MIRTVITIDKDKCNGCGLCVDACHEGAIALIDGKAQLVRDDYCDGLGNCLPVCPTGAISFENREAVAFNEQAVRQHLHGKSGAGADQAASVPSELCHWPIQLKLVPVNAPCFKGANLLIAADCAAYACGSFHADYMRDRVTLIGCPKLDSIDYSEKLTAILNHNDIASLTVARMEVPCCSGIEIAARTAIASSQKNIPFEIVTFSTTDNPCSACNTGKSQINPDR